MITNYSVLMSVYYKENPEYLQLSMESIFSQTVHTDDFVLICDGALSPELDAVICEMQKQHGDVLHIVRLVENKGLGNALNVGIPQCKNELIARMDSDDISRKDRCEMQLEVFASQPSIAVCSGIVEEFTSSIDSIHARRVLPELNSEIILFAKTRNPFNHPCVMYKKSAVIDAGSYQGFYLLEDYYLWLRMIMKGYQGYNLQKPLLYMRAGSDMYKRRSGLKYAKAQCKLFRYMWQQGFIDWHSYLSSSVLRCVSACAPNCIRKGAFTLLMRQ